MKTFIEFLVESSVIMYHGSPNKFSSFSNRRIKRGQAIYLTPSKVYAKVYGKFVYTVRVLSNNIFYFNNNSHFTLLKDKINDVLKKENQKPYNKGMSFYPFSEQDVLTGIKNGKWHFIEHPITIKALKLLKFDGFYEKEGMDENFGYFNHKNLEILSVDSEK